MTPLFSTAYFPPIAYMAALMKHPQVLIEAKETFPKQTYRNRTEIMTASGVRRLSVPVVRDNHSRTDEVTIDYKERWNVVHLRTLTAAYSASPYFMYYEDELKELLLAPYERLIDLNQALLAWLLRKLKTSCAAELTTDFVPPTDNNTLDYRYTFTPKQPYPTQGLPPYHQVFIDRIAFTPNLSVIDLLFNLGPESGTYLAQL